MRKRTPTAFGRGTPSSVFRAKIAAPAYQFETARNVGK